MLCVEFPVTGLCHSKRILYLCCRKLGSGSSVWLEYMPVTHGVAGSSPVQTALEGEDKMTLSFFLFQPYVMDRWEDLSVGEGLLRSGDPLFWVFFVTGLVAWVFLAFVLHHFRSLIIVCFRGILSENSYQFLLRNHIGQVFNGQRFLLFLHAFTIPFLVVVPLRYEHNLSQGKFFLWNLTLVVGYFVWMIFRMLFSRLFVWLAMKNDRKVYHTLTYPYILVRKVSGVLFASCFMFLFFTTPAISTALLSTLSLLLLVLYIFLFGKMISQLRRIGLGAGHILLYLCALEVLPLLVGVRCCFYLYYQWLVP